MSSRVSPRVDVLLIDDDEGVHFLVERRLRRAGRSCAWCADCTTALRFLRGASATLVLLDQRLPDRLGHELLAQLVAEDLLDGARVVVCTSHPPVADVCETLESLGAELRSKADILSRDGLAALLEGARG